MTAISSFFDYSQLTEEAALCRSLNEEDFLLRETFHLFPSSVGVNVSLAGQEPHSTVLFL